MELFDYDLPSELIAQQPAEPRESARLLVLDRMIGRRGHWHVSDLPEFFRAGDLLVFNDTKVFKARLCARHGDREHELFLLRCDSDVDDTSEWRALVRGSGKLDAGDVLECLDGPCATLISKMSDGSGEVRLCFEASREDVLAYCDRCGHIPVPPYIDAEPATLDLYQTAYAKHVGSAAAPTAGFHLTTKMLDDLAARGVQFASVTLHVGLGTFQPVKTKTLEEHHIHSEWAEISSETAEAIADAKKDGRRVIAVGTTTVRTLEGVAALYGRVVPFAGDLSLFITPGFSFRVVDGLLTNFHLPKSTLLALISAFADREHVLDAYREAVEMKYRFFSFGDAMLVM